MYYHGCSGWPKRNCRKPSARKPALCSELIGELRRAPLVNSAASCPATELSDERKVRVCTRSWDGNDPVRSRAREP